MVGILTTEMGLNPKYVLDEMQMYEINGFLEYRHLRNQATWEQTRWFGTLYANYHSKHRVYSENLIKFPWDTEHHTDERLTKKERNDMKKSKKAFEDFLKSAETSSVTLKDINKIKLTNGQ